MEEAVKEARRLLHEAEVAPDEQKQARLQKLFDLVFTAEPSLLPDFITRILQFRETPELSLRLWLVEVVEKVCLRFPDLIINEIQPEWFDDDTAVITKLLSTFARLYPQFLLSISRAVFTSPSLLSLWSVLKRVTARSFEYMGGAMVLRGVAASIKFMEAVVVAQTEPQQGDPTGVFAPSLAEHDGASSIVSAAHLQAQSRKLLKMLVEAMKAPKVASSRALVIISSLANIAAKRQEHAPYVVDALLSHIRTLRAAPKVSAITPSIEKAIKAAFLKVIKANVPFEWTDELSQLLIDAGNQKVVERYRPKHVNRALQQQMMADSAMDVDDDLTLGDSKLGASKHAIDVGQLLIQSIPPMIQITPAIKQQIIDIRAIPSLIAAQVVEGAINTLRFPPELDPLKLPPHDSSTALVQLLASALTHENRPEQLKLQYRRRAQSSSLTVKHDPRLGHALSEATALEGSSSASLKRKADSDIDGESSTKRQAVGDAKPTTSQARAKVARDASLALATPNINEKTFREAAFHRAIQSEEAMRQSALDIIVQFATGRTLENDAVVTSMLDYCAKDLERRIPLALRWLYKEWALESGRRYQTLLKIMLTYFKTRVTPKALAQFITDAPVITGEIYDFIQEVIVDPALLPVGLDALRDLVLKRPPARGQALRLILRFATHNAEVVRSATIKLISSSLVQVEALSQNIVGFASKLFLSLANTPAQAAGTAGQGTVKTEGQDEDQPQPAPAATAATSTKPSEVNEEDVKRKMMLFLALCAHKTELIDELFKSYALFDEEVKRVLRKQVTSLIHAVGQSNADLLQALRTFPKESKPLAIQVLHWLVETASPSSELVDVVRDVYTNRIHDARLLIPIIPGLTKQELRDHLPKLITLPPNMAKIALERILTARPSALSASELLVALHLQDPAQVPIKRAMEAIEVCFSQKLVVRQDVLAKVLQQLSEESPLPPLFMRTVIQSITLLKQLTGYVMTMLQRLIPRQIWTDSKLWQGYIMACKMAMPHSIPVILSLPLPQMNDVMKSEPSLKDKLVNYVTKHGDQVPSGVVDALLGRVAPAHTESIKADPMMDVEEPASQVPIKEEEPRTPEHQEGEQDAMDVDGAQQ